jgi:integrase
MAGLSLAQLTPKHIADYREARHSAVKPVTINRELGLVQHAIDMARREWNVPLNDNPVKQVHKPRQDQFRERRVRTGELDRRVAACGSCRNGYVAPLIRLAIETGMRQGELLRLTWADLDFVRRTLLIRISKNGHPRTIPMSSAAIECVGELQKLGGFANALIFPTTASALKQSWRRLTTRAGLEDLHFHDLRHEAISRFFEKGLSLPEVALISGHRDPRMLFRYTHPQPELIAPKLQ